MTINAIVAFLHFVAAFAVVSTLFMEWITFNRQLTVFEARRIQRADMIYGISAGLVIVFGLLRVFYFEKGSEYYFSSSFFYIKLFLFLFVGLLSVYPTLRFLKWRTKTDLDKAPEISEQEYKLITWILNLEMIGLFFLILAASLMAKGIDFS